MWNSSVLHRQSNDWSNVHRSDCKEFLKGSQLARTLLFDNDTVRLLLRIVLILRKHPRKEFEKVHTFDGHKSFHSLVSHSDDIIKSPFRGVWPLLSWFPVFKDLCYSFGKYMEIHGKMNASKIFDKSDVSGVWLFIAASIFDYSCLPNASFVFNGLKNLESRCQ